VCAKLDIALIHARPYRPKGKIERFFKTVRAQLLTRLAPEDTASLQALNRRWWAWVEGEYHHAPHRGLGNMTPLEQWAQTGEAVHFPEPGLDLDDLFLFEAQRKVQKDRTDSLNGVLYEVDAALVGEKVTLRFDPGAAPQRPVQTYANCFVKRNRPSWTLHVDGPVPEPPASGMKLRTLPDGPEEGALM